MRRILLAQGSEAWSRWRDGGLGASDAPAVMRASPWTTPLKLWRQKVGEVRSEPSTYAMRRGIRLEPDARRLYALRTGNDVRPACAEDDARPWLRVSFDGVDLWDTVVCEIKAPNADDHALALTGEVPPKYRWQLVHQALVSGVTVIDYVSYNPDSFAEEDEFRVVPYAVTSDELSELAEALEQFWECVTTRTPPRDRKAVTT